MAKRLRYYITLDYETIHPTVYLLRSAMQYSEQKYTIHTHEKHAQDTEKNNYKKYISRAIYFIQVSHSQDGSIQKRHIF